MKITEKGMSCKLREIKVGTPFKVLGENFFFLKLNNTPNNNVMALYVEDESYVPIISMNCNRDIIMANIVIDFNSLPF